MNILIAGCSKTGATLAGELSREGHDVSVVDPLSSSQSLLPDDYTGYFTTGILIDEDVLRNAGIENCDAVAAVSDNDNINIMVSQVAKTIFGIGTVVASLQDPAREEKFGSLITTVCPTIVPHFPRKVQSENIKIFLSFRPALILWLYRRTGHAFGSMFLKKSCKNFSLDNRRPLCYTAPIQTSEKV